MSIQEISCPLCKQAHCKFLHELEFKFYQCPDCKLEFVHPTPTNEQLAHIYSQHYYDSWTADNTFANLESMKFKTFSGYFENIVRHKNSGNLLDIGCAFGTLLKCAKSFGFTPYGIDINAKAIEKAKESGASVLQGTLEEAKYPDAFFDVVMMTDAIEHMRDPQHTITEIQRILKHGGLICITTPDTQSFSKLVWRKHWPHYKDEHLFYFNSINISRYLLKDFKVLERRKVVKHLSISYIGNLLAQYSKSAILKAFGQAMVLGARLFNPGLNLPSGEMLIIVQKG